MVGQKAFLRISVRFRFCRVRGSQKKTFVVEFRIDGGSPPQGTLIEGCVDINISNPTGRGTVRWEASPTVYHPKHPDGGGGFTPFTRDLKQNDFKYEWP